MVHREERAIVIMGDVGGVMVPLGAGKRVSGLWLVLLFMSSPYFPYSRHQLMLAVGLLGLEVPESKGFA